MFVTQKLILHKLDVSDDNNSFTESEDGYDGRVMCQPINGAMKKGENQQNYIMADSVEGRPPPMGPISPSLFPNVPPYITFVTHEEKGPAMPAAVNKILKWKLTTITPIVIRKILLNSGFRLLKRKFLF